MLSNEIRIKIVQGLHDYCLSFTLNSKVNSLLSEESNADLTVGVINDETRPDTIVPQVPLKEILFAEPK